MPGQLSRDGWIGALLVWGGALSVGSQGAAQTAPDDPPAKVPAGVIIVKGAWSSASDSTTALPEGGHVTVHFYDSPYFRFSYPLPVGWVQKYDGPPPSDSGYYVLAQLRPREGGHTGSRGTVLIAAQDMFFAQSHTRSARDLIDYTSNHLQADYALERRPTAMNIRGHSFIRLDYGSPAAGLHWSILATQIRCHTLQFVFTSNDPTLNDQLVSGMTQMQLPEDAGLTSGFGMAGEPICISGYAEGANVLNRVQPFFTDRRYNPVPVRVIIDKQGKVEHIHFISAFPEQAKAITEALRQWRFKPYVRNGKTSEVETGILFGRAPGLR